MEKSSVYSVIGANWCNKSPADASRDWMDRAKSAAINCGSGRPEQIVCATPREAWLDSGSRAITLTHYASSGDTGQVFWVKGMCLYSGMGIYSYIYMYVCIYICTLYIYLCICISEYIKKLVSSTRIIWVYSWGFVRYLANVSKGSKR